MVNYNWTFELAYTGTRAVRGEPDRWLRSCGRAKVQLDRKRDATDYVVFLRYSVNSKWPTSRSKLFLIYTSPHAVRTAVDKHFERLDKLAIAVNTGKVLL